MQLRMSKNFFRILSILVITAFLSNVYMLPALAGSIHKNTKHKSLEKFIAASIGTCTAEQILNLIQKTYPMSDEQAAEMLVAIDALLTAAPLNDDHAIESVQAQDCRGAASLFMTGLSFVLLSMVLSETLTEEECVKEECIGNFCICREEETTNPLSGLTTLLRITGNLMMVFGVLVFVQSCLFESAAPVDNHR
jgi:hypothetical protein